MAYNVSGGVREKCLTGLRLFNYFEVQRLTAYLQKKRESKIFFSLNPDAAAIVELSCKILTGVIQNLLLCRKSQ